MKDAFSFATQVGAKIAIPIHYDKLGANAEVYKTFAGYFDFAFQIHPLKNGESLDI
jgi:L-ascorbate metabolism protein UlaG (beta-lactamase superfamily)